MSEACVEEHRWTGWAKMHRQLSEMMYSNC